MRVKTSALVLVVTAAHLDLPVAVHQQIGRFEVAVHNGGLPRVQIGHTLGLRRRGNQGHEATRQFDDSHKLKKRY